MASAEATTTLQGLRQRGGGCCASSPEVLLEEHDEGKGTAMAVPLAEDHAATIEDVLDIFGDGNGLKWLSIVRNTIELNKAEMVGSALVEQGFFKPEALTPELTALIQHNLDTVLPLPSHVLSFMQTIFEKRPGWIYDDSGRVDNPPRQLDTRTLTQAEVASVRKLAFVGYPAEVLGDLATLSPVRAELFAPPAQAEGRPVAIITVGPPGVGKTTVLKSAAVPWLQANFGAPGDGYVTLDTDHMFDKVCLLRPAYRQVAFFTNHENFLCAVGARKNIIFDGTGKEVLNTCGRVASRLVQANYRIFFVVVLSSFDKSRARIAARAAATGRDVPTFLSHDVFAKLKTSIPTYVRAQESLCEALLVYDNDADGEPPPPLTATGGVGHDQAIAAALSKLETAPKE